MKNNYTISPNYLLQLENDELRERLKKQQLKQKEKLEKPLKQLKKKLKD